MCGAEIGHIGIGASLRRGALRLAQRNQPIQCVVEPAGGNQRTGKIDAHLPVHAEDLAGCGAADKTSKCACRKLDRPSRCLAANAWSGLAERMNPLGQIMEILAVPIPLQALLERLAGTALRLRLADPESACGRMPASGVFVKPA